MNRSRTFPANHVLMKDVLNRAREAILNADRILIGAGAGMGVDSGLPDFRGNEGFWNAYPPFRERGLSFYDMADPSWFHKDPAQAWGFYGHRLELYRATEPHAGFARLLQFLLDQQKDYFVFTSNVDGHFQRSGYAKDRIVECHGSIHHLQCLVNCDGEIWPNDQTVEIDEASFRAGGELPRCRRCDGGARPNILMFGDYSWNSQRTNEQEARYRRWLHQSSDPIVAIEFGAGTAVPTVRIESEAHSDTLIRVNPREPDGPRQTISLAIGAVKAIEEIAS